MMKKLLVIVFQILIISSYVNLVNADVDKVDNSILVINKTWNDAFNRGDASELAHLYAEDAVLSPEDGSVIKGRKAIEVLFQSFFDNGLHDHRITTYSYHMNGTNLYQVSKWQASAKDEQSMFSGVLTSIYKRDQQGNWKAHVHTWNVEN